jgi:predicted regulator of Ras-like GTPase activity (Roadblock/LC7/MglB family)
MPYQALLDELVRTLDRVDSALLLDASGELVVGSGSEKARHRLIGAHQGIALEQAQRTAERYALGDLRCLVWRHSSGAVIVRPLRDGYYLVVSLGPEADVARGLHRSADVQERLNAAL